MNLCGEAHVWDAGAKTLYWADCLASKFLRDARRIKKREVLEENLEINGCALNQGGGFVITTNPGIWLWDGVGQPRLLKAQVGAEKCRMNDCIADSQGRLLAGS